MLRKKAAGYNNPETLTEFHTIAKTTIDVLTKNMVMTDMTLDRMFEYYSEISRVNVVKLLIRCRKLYEARVDVKKILNAIIEKDNNMSDLLEVLDKSKKYIKSTHEGKLNLALK